MAADGSIIIDTRIDEGGFNKGVGALKSGAAAAAVAIGAAVVALGAYTVGAVKAAEADIAADARIRQIATSMGLFGAETAKVSGRLAELATKTALQTGIDDAAIKSTQAKLLTFKQLAGSADEVGGAFDRATQAAIDMQAAGFGQAEQNAVQLGKALQDPVKGITALARSGITFTASEKERIKTLVEGNKVMEAQDLVLKAIEQQVGGTAEATSTASARMSVAMGEMSESIGSIALPAFQSFADYVTTTFVPGMQNLIAMLQAGESPLSIFGDVLSKVFGPETKAQFDTFIAAVESLFARMRPAFISIGATVRSVIGAIGPQFRALLNEVIPTMTAIVQHIENGWKHIGPVVTPILKAIGTTVALVFNGMATVVRTVMALIRGDTDTALSALRSGFSTQLNLIKGIVSNVLGGIVALFRNAVSGFRSMGRALIDGLREGITSALSNLLSTARDMADKVADTVRNALRIQSPSRVFAEIGEQIAAGLAQGIGGGAGAAVAAASKMVGEVWKTATGIEFTPNFGENNWMSPRMFADMFGVSVPVSAQFAKEQQLGLSREGVSGLERASARSDLFLSQLQTAGARNFFQGAEMGGTTINFNQPVRTYSETVRAVADINSGLVGGLT